MFSDLFISPVVRSLCSHCSDPGMCCRDIRLSGGVSSINNCETKLDALVYLATVVHADDWMGNIGLPFLPDYQENGEWRMSCPRLGEKGRCGDYENRPRLCRSYVPGRDKPCAMNMLTDEECLKSYD